MITHEKKGEINMAAPKKTVKPVAKAAETVKTEASAPKVEVKKPVAAVAAPKAEEKEAPKAAVKKETAPKAAAAKKEAAPKAAAKKETAKKAPAKKTTVKKGDQKTILHVQFSGKSYAQEDLVKIAQDVWKYDLKQKVRELSSIELYVKPEENKVYYVMNQNFTGSFDI